MENSTGDREKNLIVKSVSPLGEQQTHILASDHPCPLHLWKKKTSKHGHVSVVADAQFEAPVLRLVGQSNESCHLDYPGKSEDLTLKSDLPCIVFILKGLLKPFSIDISVLDTTGIRRRLTFSTDFEQASAKTLTLNMPLRLVMSEEWQYLHLNLDRLTRQAFNTPYEKTLRIRIYPNCHLYRVYFTRSCKEGENVLI